MARDQLGLFDTPPARSEIRLSIAIVVFLFVALLAILPARDIRLVAVQAFVPTINAAMFAGELIIGALLFSQAAVFRSRALTVLASGYVFAGVLLVPHALTFPGAFFETGLLGAGVNTTAWLAVFRRLVFPFCLILYAWLKQAESASRPDAHRPPPRVSLGLAVSISLAAAATSLAIVGQDLLPPFFINQREAIHANLLVLNSITIALTATAMIMLLRQKKSVLDMWLLVALSGWLFQSLLNLPLNARFTLGWYCLFGMMLVSDLIVMLALMAESSRLYSRLALSVAVRRRERDARLMSMDAVAAAIAHEVGQPLAAVTLNAAAGLDWLHREPPDSKMAIGSLRATIDAVNRTFEVIKSIRATVGTRSDSLSKFSLDNLVRETTALLDNELTEHKVLLQFDLDDSLPEILANRVQIQRVLTNLLVNAIESIGPARRRTRLITIRSAMLDSKSVLVEVRDSGGGIAPEKLPHIFDPFFTTKSTGTGLGLSLSRTIVEEHGGRLWATPGEKHGAVFHIQLPRAPGG